MSFVLCCCYCTFVAMPRAIVIGSKIVGSAHHLIMEVICSPLDRLVRQSILFYVYNAKFTISVRFSLSKATCTLKGAMFVISRFPVMCPSPGFTKAIPNFMSRCVLV